MFVTPQQVKGEGVPLIGKGYVWSIYGSGNRGNKSVSRLSEYVSPYSFSSLAMWRGDGVGGVLSQLTVNRECECGVHRCVRGSLLWRGRHVSSLCLLLRCVTIEQERCVFFTARSIPWILCSLSLSLVVIVIVFACHRSRHAALAVCSMQLLQYCCRHTDWLRAGETHVMSIMSRGESLGWFRRSVTVSNLTAWFRFSKANPLSSFEYPSSAKGWCMFILAVFTCRIMAKMLQGQSKDHTNQVWFVCNQRACHRLVGCTVRISQSAGFFPLFFFSSSLFLCMRA